MNACIVSQQVHAYGAQLDEGAAIEAVARELAAEKMRDPEWLADALQSCESVAYSDAWKSYDGRVYPAHHGGRDILPALASGTDAEVLAAVRQIRAELRKAAERDAETEAPDAYLDRKADARVNRRGEP